MRARRGIRGIAFTVEALIVAVAVLTAATLAYWLVQSSVPRGYPELENCGRDLLLYTLYQVAVEGRTYAEPPAALEATCRYTMWLDEAPLGAGWQGWGLTSAAVRVYRGVVFHPSGASVGEEGFNVTVTVYSIEVYGVNP